MSLKLLSRQVDLDGQSDKVKLLVVNFPTIADDLLFRLPILGLPPVPLCKVEEIETTGSARSLSEFESDVLHFRGCNTTCQESNLIHTGLCT